MNAPPPSAPRRVLFLARYLDAGGIPVHLKTLGAGLRRAGVEVAVASRGRVEDHPHGPAWLEAHGIRHFSVPFPLSGASALPDGVRAAVALRKTVRTFRPDLLHVHWRSVSPFARLVEIGQGIPFVSTLHTTSLPAGGVHRLLSFWGARTICVSAAASAFLQEQFGIAPERIRVIPHGVDSTHFRPPTPEERQKARVQVGLMPDDHVVALIGSLYSNKGQRVLIEALARLREGGLLVTALLAGAGDAAPLRTQAKTLGVAEQVRFLGHTDARAVLWSADALALPSRHEAFALVVAEAMLCGVVPVRTPGPGSDEQIEDGVTGFLVPVGDADALAARLRVLLTEPPRRRQMAEAARTAAISRFTQERMVHQTLDVYREVLLTTDGGRQTINGGR